jgi:hypothetical protein
MRSKLEKTLNEMSKKVAISSYSKYFWIHNLIVRTSDHYSITSDYDITIYQHNKIFVCVPNKVPNKKFFVCKSVNEVIQLLKSVSLAKDLHLNPALPIQQEAEIFSCFIDELLSYNLNLRKKQVEFLNNLSKERKEIVTKYLNVCKRALPKEYIKTDITSLCANVNFIKVLKKRIAKYG